MKKTRNASIFYLLFFLPIILVLSINAVFAVISNISHLDVTEDTWAVSLLRGKSMVQNAIIFEGVETNKPQAWAWGIVFKSIKENNDCELITYWKGVKACKEKMQNDSFSIIKSWNISSTKGQQAYEIVNNDKYDNTIKDCVSSGKTLDILNFTENDENYYVCNSPGYAKRILKKCGVVDDYEELFPIKQRLAELKNSLCSISQEIADINIEFGCSSFSSYDMESLYSLDLSQLSKILQSQETMEKIRKLLLKEQKKELYLKNKEDKFEYEKQKREFELNHQKRREEEELKWQEQEREIHSIKAYIEAQHALEMNRERVRKTRLENKLMKLRIKEETPKDTCNIS